MKNVKILKEKKFNFGLGILRVILSFDVIRHHCFDPKSTKNKIILILFAKRSFHVPCFYILSFLFMAKYFILINFNILYKRLQRLLIPYICWPIIIYFINNHILHVLFKSNKIPLKNLKFQLLWGNNFIHQLWYQWDLIALTIIFFIIIFIFRKYHEFTLEILTIFAYVLQYSGYNIKFYNSISSEKKNTLGRFVEVVPFATTGFILGSLKIIDFIQYMKIKTFILSLLIFNLVKKYDIFAQIKGHSYPGIILNVRSICLIFIFSLFPSEKIKNHKIMNILKYFTNYTAGVFYLHMTIYRFLVTYVRSIKNHTFSGCIIIYLVCFSISSFSMKFAGKTIFRNLFS